MKISMLVSPSRRVTAASRKSDASRKGTNFVNGNIKIATKAFKNFLLQRKRLQKEDDQYNFEAYEPNPELDRKIANGINQIYMQEIEDIERFVSAKFNKNSA